MFTQDRSRTWQFTQHSNLISNWDTWWKRMITGECRSRWIRYKVGYKVLVLTMKRLTKYNLMLTLAKHQWNNHNNYRQVQLDLWKVKLKELPKDLWGRVPIFKIMIIFLLWIVMLTRFTIGKTCWMLMIQLLGRL